MLNHLPEIIERIRKGEHEAFRLVVEEYRQKAFSVAFRIICNEEEARDAVQESFIKVWEKLGQYDMNRNFDTWMVKIVVNTAIDRKRKLDRFHIVRFEQAEKQLEWPDPEVSQKATDNMELAQLINRLARGLPEKQRMVFILRDIQGMESQEVQQILDLSENSVKSNLYHARSFIREKLVRIIN
jgi:RNA polymerase sigma-70 factor (ECF subfamily)